MNVLVNRLFYHNTILFQKLKTVIVLIYFLLNVYLKLVGKLDYGKTEPGSSDYLCTGEQPYCWMGAHPTSGMKCCAQRRTLASVPDFSDIQLKANSECHSLSSNRIVNGVCLDQSSCNLHATSSMNYTWTSSSNTATCLEPGRKDCNENFASEGGLANCTEPISLVTVAKCFKTANKLPVVN